MGNLMQSLSDEELELLSGRKQFPSVLPPSRNHKETRRKAKKGLGYDPTIRQWSDGSMRLNKLLRRKK